MVNMQDVLINKKIPPELSAKLEALTTPEEPILFIISGELTVDSKYGNNLLAVTAKELIVYDIDADSVTERIAFTDIEKIERAKKGI